MRIFNAKAWSTVPPGAMSEVFAEWLMARVVSMWGSSSTAIGCCGASSRFIATATASITMCVRPRWALASWWLASATCTHRLAMRQCQPSAGVTTG